MQRAAIEQYLRQAVAHVAQGEGHIARQKHIIAQLERDGRDTTRAYEMLATFEITQKIHIGDRDRLQRELSEASKSPRRRAAP